MLSERQKDILKAVIEEHIREAQPVGSKVLCQKYDFSIGPAMVRNEMNELEHEGYLAQPHTSAGRVPTDKAYRLYIQEEMARPKVLSLKESEKINEAVKDTWPNEASLLREVSRVAADISRELSISGLVGGQSVYTAGFARLFQEPEFHDLASISHLMRFMDNAEHHFDRLWEMAMADSGFNVLIGQENPIREINEFSLVTGKYSLPQGEEGFVSVIGPKRMDYRKNMALVQQIADIINQM